MTDQELRDLVASLAVNSAKMDERFDKEVKEREKANREWHAKFDKEVKEREKEREKANREWHENFEREKKESRQKFEELRLYIQGVSSELRGLGLTQGDIAEEIFYRSLSRHKQLGEIHFDDIRRRVRDSRISPEFDILLINSVSVGLIEIKANLKTQLKNLRIPKKDKGLELKYLIDKKVNQFRESSPEYEGYKLYVGFGSLVTDDEIIAQARENGIFLLTADGDHIEVVNDNVRAF